MTRNQVKNFPDAVIEGRDVLKWNNRRQEQLDILKILANENSPYRDDLIKFWRALEKREIDKDEIGKRSFRFCWVERILDRVIRAGKLPPYFFISGEERKLLVQDINKLSNKLIKKYKTYGLNVNLFHRKSQIFGDWNIYEDFGETNRSRIDYDNIEKLEVCVLISFLARRATEQINKAKVRGKASKNVRAISFVRNMAEENQQSYGSPLNEVIVTATRELYDVSYAESDIRNLLVR